MSDRYHMDESRESKDPIPHSSHNQTKANTERMKRRAISTLLLCHTHQISSFMSPQRHKRKLVRNSQMQAEERIDEHIVIEVSKRSGTHEVSSRRQFLATAVPCSALLPLVSNAEDLSNVILGNGSWVESPTQAAPSSISIPPSFTTYLTRFIIHYDDAASLWWKENNDSYSLLSADEAVKRGCRDFANLARSVEIGLADFLSSTSSTGAETQVRERYAALFTSLVDKYAEKDDAIRHLGLMFAMLPKEYQPLTSIKTQLGNLESVSAMNQIDTRSQDDIMSLLPDTYEAVYNPTAKCYQINPALDLIENQDGEIISTIFGPLSSQSLTRQRPNLGKNYYTLLGISGGVGCALTHSLVIPLDVVKTRMQTNPSQFKGVFEGALAISQNEGLSSLLLGTQATIVGYLWYGISVYPSYTFFKNTIAHALPNAFAVAHINDVALAAGAIASIIASLGLTPIEAARIRAVAEPDIYKKLGLMGTLAVIAEEDVNVGWKNLYAGLPSLMTRQVIFGSVKFLAFERVSEAILVTWPMLRDGTMASLGVSLIAGGISGALSSVVSQPADSVLTYVTKQSTGNMGIIDGAKLMIQKEGARSLFRGLGSRCVWAGCIIAGQFLLYDVFRGMFGITGDDLNQVYELVLVPSR